MEKEDSCKKIISEIIAQCNKHDESYFNTNIIIDINRSIDVIRQVNEILDKEPAVLTINIQTLNCSNLVIVGDLHGNLESLARIINNYGYPPKKRYLFLGDYVDRGKNSCAVIIMLYALKCLYHDDIFLIRGNHEFKNMTDHYGFKDECFRVFQNFKDGELFYNMVVETFSKLPICAILNDQVFVVHGGVSALIESREQLLKIKKVGEDFTSEDSVQAEFLWSDPQIDYLQYEPSPRGIGCLFGQNALNEFLEKMQLIQVIRGHQNEMDGYNYPFDKEGRILTVFSSIDYCGMLNDAAVAILNDKDNSLKLEIETFRLLPKKCYTKMRIVLPEEILLSSHEPFGLNLSQIPNLILAD